MQLFIFWFTGFPSCSFWLFWESSNHTFVVPYQVICSLLTFLHQQLLATDLHHFVVSMLKLDGYRCFFFTTSIRSLLNTPTSINNFCRKKAPFYQEYCG